MPEWLGQAAGGAIGGAINTGLGLLLEDHNDRRQLEQHADLGRQQMGFDMEKMRYQNKMAKEMWDATNVGAQVGHLKDAGMSVGLAYNGSGAGGTTAGGGSGGNINTGDAPKGGGEIMGLQLMNAQKGLLEAQTRKADADAKKTAGPDTRLTTAQGGLAEIQASLAADTYEDTQNKIKGEAQKLLGQGRQEASKGQEMHETEETRISIKEAELVGISLANELKREGIKQTQEQVNALIESVKQKWAEVGVKKDKLKLDQFINDVATSTRLTVETASKVITSLFGKTLPKTK